MMRTYPTDESDIKEAEKLNLEPWMLEQLKLNPEYVFWGPHEDYMGKDGQGWDSRLLRQSWAEGKIELNDLNEVVNFYFEVGRASQPCAACDQSGLNPATKVISDTFYDHENAFIGRPSPNRWCDKITQDEVDALIEHGRLWDLTRKGSAPAHHPTAEEVNAWERGRGMGHDAINRWILIETRAKRLGVWGHCEHCDGDGTQFTEPAGHLNLVVWILHPRKGCSRGMEISHIEKQDLPDIYNWLRDAADRNAARFEKVRIAIGSQILGVDPQL
jgi:hypothetical protein